MSSTRSRLLLTWATVVLACPRIGALCSRTWRIVSVVSSSVRPSLSSGTATSTTSSTKAQAATSPAISPTDTRAPVLGLRFARLERLRVRPGVVTLDDLFQGSVIVGGEAAGDGGADVVVVPDGCGEGQDALPDADADSLGGMPAVLFEVELALEGVINRLDHLPEGFEELRSRPVGLALAGRAQQSHPGVGQGRLELVAVVVLVRDHDLAAPLAGQCRVGVQDAEESLALVGFCPGQREADRQAAPGAQQVQPQAPEVAGGAGGGGGLGPG